MNWDVFNNFSMNRYLRKTVSCCRRQAIGAIGNELCCSHVLSFEFRGFKLGTVKHLGIYAVSITKGENCRLVQPWCIIDLRSLVHCMRWKLAYNIMRSQFAPAQQECLSLINNTHVYRKRYKRWQNVCAAISHLFMSSYSGGRKP